MSDYLAFLYMQRLNEKHPHKPFHLTSHCDYWHWWYPLTISRLCISCMHVLIYCDLFLPVLHDVVSRMGPGGGICLRSDSMGYRLWGFAHLAHAMDFKWDVKSSHPFTASDQLGCLQEKLDYLSKSSRPLAGVGDAGCFSSGQEHDSGVGPRADTVTRALHWIYALAGSPPFIQEKQDHEVRMYFQF